MTMLYAIEIIATVQMIIALGFMLHTFYTSRIESGVIAIGLCMSSVALIMITAPTG